jgi:16S rRNA (uracil1498-N3)-methyltransferase
MTDDSGQSEQPEQRDQRSQTDQISALPNTYRFFVPPAALAGDSVQLSDPELAHQIGRVLRLRPGSRVLLLDGSGMHYLVRLTSVERTQLAGEIEQRAAATGEPALALTIYVSLLRAERFEWVLQKGTELGVSQFVPLRCARTQASDQPNERKLARWQRIIREAAEQASRARLPTLGPTLDFAAGCEHASTAELALLLWEGARLPASDQPTPTLRAVLRGQQPPPPTLALISGPEGGFEPTELTSAAGRGIISVSLGPRILRAETAPIAAAAALFYELEDPGG